MTRARLLRNTGRLWGNADPAHPESLLEIPRGAMVWEDGIIRWVGPEAELPEAYRRLPHDAIADAGGMLVLPGLIDCHTHLAFAGWRADEFARRCRGTGYEEIARSGGGIRRTVEATRRATAEELADRAVAFVQQMVRLGVTTIECKSGYGLSRAEEIKLLEVYGEVGRRSPARIVSTLLAAHVVPPEFSGRRSEYVELICRDIIPEVAERKLACFCDVFVERGAFTLDEARQILAAGHEYGLRAKLHADQLRDGRAAELAAEVDAVSADHLEYAGRSGIEAMARRGVVAVALPLASLYLRQPPLEARRWIEAGVPLALATDFNPGSAPTFDLLLAMMLGCTMCGMTPVESLRAATREAARAIAMEAEIGSLAKGKRADFVLVDAPDIDHFLYHFRPDAVHATYIDGRLVYERRLP